MKIHFIWSISRFFKLQVLRLQGCLCGKMFCFIPRATFHWNAAERNWFCFFPGISSLSSQEHHPEWYSNSSIQKKKQVPHMGILGLKEMYKIIMDEFLSANYSFLHLWREPIMTETHWFQQCSPLQNYRCVSMGTSVQPSTCFMLRRQNPNVLPPDFPPWLTPLQFLKDLQGGIWASSSQTSRSLLQL